MNKYIPTHSDLFNFEYIRCMKDNSFNFKIETYNNLPILFICEDYEEELLTMLIDQLINWSLIKFQYSMISIMKKIIYY